MIIASDFVLGTSEIKFPIFICSYFYFLIRILDVYFFTMSLSIKLY